MGERKKKEMREGRKNMEFGWCGSREDLGNLGEDKLYSEYAVLKFVFNKNKLKWNELYKYLRNH